jgi:ribonuclease P protein component
VGRLLLYSRQFFPSLWSATFRIAMPHQSLKFGKAQRLTRAAEFRRVREFGRLLRGNLLSLAVLKDALTERLRVGIVTSRKVGAAAVRSRVRRRLREIVRRHQHEIAAGSWIVVISRPSAAGASYQRLEEELLRLARRASILTA